ncbi:hypothetical protein GCM10010836_01240 [Aminobacter aminovorans]
MVRHEIFRNAYAQQFGIRSVDERTNRQIIEFEYAPGSGEKPLSLAGEDEGTAGPPEKRAPQQIFEPDDLLADGRLRTSDNVGSRSETARFGDRRERAEQIDF